MNYTSLERVKAALDALSTGDDDLIGNDIIPAASRAIDVHCAGLDSDNYFELATITDEICAGRIDANGNLRCWPRKPLVLSISALAYRATPRQAWLTVPTEYVTASRYSVIGWGVGLPGDVQAKISYQGGLGSTLDTLSDDLIDAATVLSVRFYKELKSGLSDAIGVAELGQLVYTKALPVRVVKMLQPYKRVIA